MKIYEKSIRDYKCGKIFMGKAGDGNDYIVSGASNLRLNHKTAEFLRSEFPWTNPSRVLSYPKTFGTGDRLGIATPGHIRCFENNDTAPVFAQQSIRELTLTNRTYEDVIDAATFAVFREGFQKPWGFDGDHLKTFEEIEYAFRCGCTMLTLDCSEKIGIGGEPTQEMREYYLGRSFEAENFILSFTEAELSECSAVYGAALNFICEVFEKYMSVKSPYKGRADFEISIDETSTPTTPLQHCFVASELRRRGIEIQTLAPRFCGEFQKGIDYIGGLGQFEREMEVHSALARVFGYKLSIHSGSDKLSVFPIIAKCTQGRFHLKTAGTSWLEAVKLVSMKDPALYREIHEYALSVLTEAKKYYRVTTDLTKIPDILTLSDTELPSLFLNPDARQLLHITYGLILRPDLSYRGKLSSLWREYDEEYFALLQSHIGRHLELLGIR